MKRRQEFKLEGAGPPVSHYTDAVRFGDLLFISGTVALDADNHVIAPDDAAGQAEAIFQTLGRILAAHGAGFADVLKVNVYLTDIEDRPLINPVRQRYFGDAKPASTLVQVGALVFPELKVEIEAVAGLPAA